MTQEHFRVPVWTHESIQVLWKWTSAIRARGNSLWRAACPIIVINTLSCYAISRWLPPLCSLALRLREHQSTCVDSWVHRVPENGHQPLGRGYSLWRSACPILWSNPFLLRYFTEIVPSVLPCPKTQEHQSTFVIKPYRVTLFHDDCPLCAPLP